MHRFAYKGIDSDGKESAGIIEAEDQTEALSEVGRMGLFVTDMHPARMTDEWIMKRRSDKETRLAKEEAQSKRDRAKRPRQRLVVRFADGRTAYGVSFALDPHEHLFVLDLVDERGASTGEVEKVHFTDLKAVFQVKSFDGKFDRDETFAAPFDERGRELVIEFQDGEVLRGFVMGTYDPYAPRFFLMPREQNTNNINVLVEAKAVEAVYSPEEYREKLKTKRAQEKSAEVSPDITQEESMGDFYFETRNYDAALEQYQAAAEKHPHGGRLRRKVLASRYNIGVQHIKRHEYEKALGIMEEVYEEDPRNAHAKKKIYQLRRIVEREKK